MIEFTARGSGYYRLYVDDVEISRHVTERECIERAVNEKTTTNVIHYVHDYTVDVVALTDAGITEARDYAGPTDLPPTITSTPGPLFQYLVSSNYDMTQHVSDDGISTVTYSLSNVLPNGLTFNGSTGILNYDGIGESTVSSHQLTATDAVGSDVSASFSLTISAVDPFTFTDQTGVIEGNTVTSNAIIVTGLVAPQTAQISVSLGEYQVNGGGWVSAPGSVTENDSVEVRHTAAAGTVNQLVTIGSQQDTFSSTTGAGFASQVLYDGLVIPPDSLLFFYEGQHQGGTSTTVSDSTKFWTPGELVGLVMRNTSLGTTGTVSANSVNTVASDVTFNTNNYYEIVADIAANDIIEYADTTDLGGAVAVNAKGVPSIVGISGNHSFTWRVFDEALQTWTPEATVTITV
jgi:hypothetical protein